MPSRPRPVRAGAPVACGLAVLLVTAAAAGAAPTPAPVDPASPPSGGARTPASPPADAPTPASPPADTPVPASPAADGPDRSWTNLAERLEGTPLPAGVRVPRVAPTAEHGGYTAKILEPTAIVASPGSRRRVWTAGTTTIHTGNATRLMVQQARFDAAGRAWLEVQVPIRPNETSGWVPADVVGLEHTPWYVRIRLGDRSLTTYRDGRRVAHTRGVIGAPATPTPTGTFAVYEIAKQASPRDFLGPWAIHLTALSNVLTNYGGGPGRVAIHGRGPQSLLDAPLGAAASHGCVRVSNDAVSWLRTRAAPGTPVRITVR